MNYVPEQRKKIILEILEKNHAISTRDAAAHLGVTRETARQDIAALNALNLLKQVRGGAMILSSSEPSRIDRSNDNPTGKKMMAKLAAEMVTDGATVLLDSGSSTYTLALELQHKNELNIITNDLDIAILLRKTCSSVTVLGGQLSPRENATEGHTTITATSEYFADFAFIGIGGVSAQRLFSDYTRDGAKVRSAMIANSAISVILADKTKFGHITPVQLNNIDALDFLVCDTDIDDVITDQLNGHSITVLFAHKPS